MIIKAYQLGFIAFGAALAVIIQPLPPPPPPSDAALYRLQQDATALLRNHPGKTITLQGIRFQSTETGRVEQEDELGWFLVDRLQPGCDEIEAVENQPCDEE